MATTTAVLQNLAAQWAVPDDPTLIVDLIKRSGILQTALVLPSSHGNKHKYKYFNSLPSSAFRALGAGIVPSAISHNTAAIDLWDVSALAQEDATEIEAYPGGKAGWIRANMGAFIEGMGQTIAKQIIYGTDITFGSTAGFLGLHQYTKANSNVIQAGGTTGSRTSIFAVRWDASNGASLRVNAGTTGNLIKVNDITPVNPALVVTSTTTNAQLPVYSWWLNAFMTLINPADTASAVITQVDASNAPTYTEMNQLLDYVDAGSGQTYIYCNSLGARMIASLKDTKLNLFSETMNYNDYVSSWRGVPIIIDNNILSTETTALD
jgi:hypothetical protein